MIVNREFSPEQEIILDFLRLEGSGMDQFRKRTLPEINWRILQEESLKQGILPLIYGRIKEIGGDPVPEKVLESWKSLYLINAEHNLMLAQKLIQVLDLLSVQGIKILPFKGPTLAIQGQGDLSRRQISDLDFLVPRHEATITINVLAGAGFIPDFRFTEKMKHYLIRTRKDLWLNRGNLVVDLHQQIPEGPLTFALKEILWEDLGSIELLNRQVPIMSLENTILVLCLHGAEDGWDTLGKIADLAFLIHTHPDLNWEALFSRAEAMRMVKILGLGLCLAREISGLKIPQEVQTRIEGDAKVKKMSARIIRQIFSDAFSPFAMTIMTRFLDSFKDKIRYVGYFAFTPRTRDLINHPLPDLLFPLYYLIHPARMLFKFIPSLFQFLLRPIKRLIGKK